MTHDPTFIPSSGQTRAAVVASKPELVRGVVRDYLELTKPEITFLVALSGLGGFVLAPAEYFEPVTLVFLLIGIALTSSGASALNHWFERDLDGLMRRTMNRPLPAGRVSASAAGAFGFVLLAAGVGLLCPLTNPLTGVLSLVTAFLYLFVYTPLKRKTSWNTLVGTLPGALPALGGWTAATGSIGWGGWAIFGILAVWQMPHFLALAWMYKKDYERGGHLMLPVTDPSGTSTVRQTLFFTLLLLPVSFGPIFLGLAGGIYGLSILIAGAWFVSVSIRFFRTYSVQDARGVLKASILYIPVLVFALVADRIFEGGLFS